MPPSYRIYEKALEIKETLYKNLRTVTLADTLMPDDYNIPHQIIKQLLEAENQFPKITDRIVKIGDNVEAKHISDLRELCYQLWMYINNILKDPYTDDPDFKDLKDILDTMRLPKHGDELKVDEWNSIFNFSKKIIDLILRYPAGFFEPWSNWSHILENWYLDYEGYLDFSTYVSPPSSYTAPSNFEADSQCLLRHPDYTNVPYVMIETWAKTKGDWGEKGGALGFLFRSPFRTISLYEEHGGVEEGWWYLLYFADSPYILFLDTYQIKCKAYWLESEESWIKLIGETTPFYKPEHANVWNKYRAYINKAGYGVELKLEYWDGNKWLTMASFYHNSNTFHGNYDYYHGVSIPALYMELIDGEWVYRDVRTWIDDTMICKI